MTDDGTTAHQWLIFFFDKSLAGESRLLRGAALAAGPMMVPPPINGLSFYDKSLVGESRYLQGTALAVEPMMAPPPINDLSFYDKSLGGEIR